MMTRFDAFPTRSWPPRVMPSVLTIASGLILAANWRELPKTVPMNYTLSGAPRGGRHPKTAALTLSAAGPGFAVAPYLPDIAEDREDSLLAAAIGSLSGTSLLGSTAAVVADARGDDRPGRLVLIALGLGTAVAAGVLFGPLTAGLRRAWRWEACGDDTEQKAVARDLPHHRGDQDRHTAGHRSDDKGPATTATHP